MRWINIDPIQAVDALLLTGDGAADRLDAALSQKPSFARTLPKAQGEGWAAVFARTLPGEREAMIPSIGGALPLYEAERGWYFPVGLQLDAPADMVPELLQYLAEEADLRPPAILTPRDDGRIDAYPVRLFHPSEQAAGAMAG